MRTVTITCRKIKTGLATGRYGVYRSGKLQSIHLTKRTAEIERDRLKNREK